MAVFLQHSAPFLPRTKLTFGSNQGTAKVTTIVSSHRSDSLPRFRLKQPKWLLSSGDEPSNNAFFRFVEVKPDEKILEHRSSRAYRVKLITGTGRDSSFTEPGGRIWLALIGQSGEAALRCVDSGSRFQSGDVDVIEFSGPDLGKLEALWIGPESGAWRLEKAVVSVAPDQNQNDDNNSEDLVYIFQGSGDLLGDGGDLLAIELKALEMPRSSSRNDQDTMREYESLKQFLLVSHTALVGVGTGILVLSRLNDEAMAFAVGGGAGLVYLFLLEGMVDQIGKGDAGNVLLRSVRKALVLSVVVAAGGGGGVVAVVTRGSVISHGDVSPTSLLKVFSCSKRLQYYLLPPRRNNPTKIKITTKCKSSIVARKNLRIFSRRPQPLSQLEKPVERV